MKNRPLEELLEIVDKKDSIFEPNVGWKLHVYQYMNSLWEDSDDLLFDQYVHYAGINIKDLILKDNIERLVMESAVDADLNHEINKGYIETDDDLNDLLYSSSNTSSPALLTGGKGNDLGCEGGNCGGRSTLQIPFTIVQMKAIYETFDKTMPKSLEKAPAREKRAFFCKLMIQDQAYCKRLNAYYRKEYDLPEKVKKNYTDKELENKIILPPTPSLSSSSILLVLVVLQTSRCLNHFLSLKCLH